MLLFQVMVVLVHAISLSQVKGTECKEVDASNMIITLPSLESSLIAL